MSNEDRQQHVAARQRAFSKVLARTMAQVGVLTVLIVIVTLAVGMWLDTHFDTRPLWTIALLVASIPVTTVMMYFVVRRSGRQLDAPPRQAGNEMDEAP